MEIKILGNVYNTSKTTRKKLREHEKYDGEINFETKEINIYRGLSVEDSAETLIHEVFHGLIKEFKLEENFEEYLVGGLAKNLLKFLQDNPNIDLRQPFKRGE